MDPELNLEIPKLRLVDFVHNYINIEGKPFRLEGRPYLWPIYTQNHKKIMLKFGRQCEKSSCIASKILHYSCGIPFFRSLYVTPSGEQTRQFSTDKMRPLITGSPILSKKYIQSQEKTIDRVFQKQFSNGSTIHFRSAFHTADRTRGITADLLALDEIQDILQDHIPVIAETTSHSNYGVMVYAGTPKTFENTLQQQWLRTSQNEFLIRCDGCRKYNFIDEGNIGKRGLVCSNKQCGKALSNVTGAWVSLNPGAPIAGFRVPQLIVPWVKWDEILEKYEAYDKGKFYNEVLGLAHDISEMACTERQLIVCCDPNRPNIDKITPRLDGRLPFYPHIYMGVDWGHNLGSYTVVTVGGFMDKRFDVLYLEKFKDLPDHMDQIERIAEIAHRFNVALIGSDYGAGFMESAELAKRLPNRKVVKIDYSGTAKAKLNWNDTSNMYIASRNATMADVFSLVGRSTVDNRLIQFPRWQDFKPFARDFLVIFKDYNSRTRQVYYDHGEGQENADDAMHAVNFCYLAAMAHTGYVKTQ